jgi:hypothetical protein
MDGRAPTIIVLALGAGALGGPDALLDLAERSPLVDIAICLLITTMLTAQLLGVALRPEAARPSSAPAAGRVVGECRKNVISLIVTCLFIVHLD